MATTDVEASPGAALASMFPGKYICLTTFKRDGRAVPTPVWFAIDGGRLLVMTASRSGKVRRIRGNAEVTVASCSASGRPRGEPVRAHAKLLPESELHRVTRLMNRKYRVDRVLILPIYRVVQRLHGVHGALSDAVLAITPTV